MDSSESETSLPEKTGRRRLSLFDTTCIIVGIIIGSTIFESLPFIAYNVVEPSHQAYSWFVALTDKPRGLDVTDVQRTVYQGSAGLEYELVAGAGLRFAWVLGGLLALIGALCLAELATTYPEDGGIFVYLKRAYGNGCAVAYVWMEFLLIRPGNIGAVAFVAAVYMQQLCPLPPGWWSAEAIWALILVTGITLVNLLGFVLEKWMQNGLTVAKILGLVTVVIVAWWWPLPNNYQFPPTFRGPPQSFAVAMTLIMFAYGGWSDMVYVAAEVREPKKNLFRSLALGVTAVTAIYLIVVDSFLHALPFRAIRNGSAVAAELMSLHFGERGANFISALVVISCLGSVHGMLFTSSRVLYAAGKQHRLMRWLGAWNERWGVPIRALFLQGFLTLILIVVFGQSKSGFTQLVNFTAPFYFGFLGLVALALVLLRYNDRQSERPYLVPFYPITPFIFGATSLAMTISCSLYLWQNLQGWQWIWVVFVVGLAVTAPWLDRRQQVREKVA